MISIIGPGGVGGLLAGLIARSGQDVTIVARPATARLLTAQGLTIDSAQFGKFAISIPVRTAPPKGAPAIIAVKQYGLADVLNELESAGPGEVLSLLNGINHAPLIHAQFPGTPTTSGSINVVVERRDDGVIWQHSPFVIVNVPTLAADWEITRVLIDAGVEVRIEGNEDDVLWRKLRFLAPLALLTAWGNAPIDQLLDAEPELVGKILTEVAAVATAEGSAVSPEELLAGLERVPGGSMSSLALDVRRGGPTELNWIGNDLIAHAEEQGIKVPTLQRLVTEIAARLPRGENA